MKLRNYLILYLLLFTGFLSAQPLQYKFTHLDITKGLSHNQVNCILKDSKGFMWFGTMAGLNRFDGYSFKKFTHSLQDPTSINDNLIYWLTEDYDGKIWIGTNNGINIYDPKTETFERNVYSVLYKLSIIKKDIHNIINDKFGSLWLVSRGTGLYRYQQAANKCTLISHHDGDKKSLYSNDISSITTDSHGDIWVIFRDAVLEKIDRKTNRVVVHSNLISKMFGGELYYFNLFADADGDVWVYSTTNPKGLFYYNVKKNELSLFSKESAKCPLNNNVVRCIVQDNQGTLWIGTDHGGINLLDKKNFTVRYLENNPDDESCLSQNTVISLYKDNTGIIWAGTFKRGINYYHEDIVKFPLFKHGSSKNNSLPYDDVNSFAEDAKGNLWIGTNGGGLLYFNRALGTFTRYTHDPANPNSLSNDIIVYLYIDSDQKLWIGTYFGGLNYFENGKFTHYRHDQANPRSIADDRIWKILEDSHRNLWVGTLFGGLDLFDRKTKQFIHFRDKASNPVHSNCITSLTEDKERNLWVGTANGIEVLDHKTGCFYQLLHNTGNPSSLSNNNVIVIKEDSRGWIWAGTREGLNLYNKKTKSFTIFRIENGLPDNLVQTILEDKLGNMWVGTANGLANIIVKQGNKAGRAFEIKTYDESDGLQGREFNESAACALKSGELIFGGANGFNLFDPSGIKTNKSLPRIAFTNFLIFNKPVKVGDNGNGRVILDKAINETKEITLKYSENMISIEFSALSFFHPEKNKYKYKLEGFNKDWITTDGSNRKAVYTNLDPGEYTFKVKASNNDGIWNNTGESIKITVLPPFWKTRLAMLFYILLIIGALYLSKRILLQRERLNFRIEQERLEARRMHELDMMKIKFFTNVSHEFRTPLTLIITPLEKILKSTKNAEHVKQLQLIQRNARRLLNLVNQLLDFRKLEVHEIKLMPSRGDIVKFVNDLVYSFSDISENKHIRFSFHSTVTSLETFFDQDKLEKIIFNLLSNAFKFTPEHGEISVTVNLIKKYDDANDGQWVEIKVTDTGIGIPEEKHAKIFERFFQNDLPGNLINQGSGIGLALTSEFVKLHGGTISVESEPGKGSCFRVLLPASGAITVNESPVGDEFLKTTDDNEPVKTDGKKPVLLLVEDNEDFRFYLKDNLKGMYHILEAADGKKGWKQALNLVPDLIVSDVMMPVMDGIEFCRKVKADQRTSHIPVILLTAMSSDEQKADGFDTGADDYITKPFNFELLESRIRNLIAQRNSLRKALETQIDLNPSQISVTSLDDKLIQKALELVEKNISNADFSVEDFSRELGMSRVHLYKKLVSLTGKTPIEFIRTIRLKRALQLMDKSQLSVSEIAYKVGFNTPKYFTRYFKDEYNVLPSQYTPGMFGSGEKPKEPGKNNKEAS